MRHTKSFWRCIWKSIAKPRLSLREFSIECQSERCHELGLMRTFKSCENWHPCQCASFTNICASLRSYIFVQFLWFLRHVERVEFDRSRELVMILFKNADKNKTGSLPKVSTVDMSLCLRIFCDLACVHLPPLNIFQWFRLVEIICISMCAFLTHVQHNHCTSWSSLSVRMYLRVYSPSSLHTPSVVWQHTSSNWWLHPYWPPQLLPRFHAYECVVLWLTDHTGWRCSLLLTHCYCRCSRKTSAM